MAGRSLVEMPALGDRPRSAFLEIFLESAVVSHAEQEVLGPDSAEAEMHLGLAARINRPVALPVVLEALVLVLGFRQIPPVRCSSSLLLLTCSSLSQHVVPVALVALAEGQAEVLRSVQIPWLSRFCRNGDTSVVKFGCASRLDARDWISRRNQHSWFFAANQSFPN